MLQYNQQANLSTHDRAILDSILGGPLNYSQDHFSTFRTYSSQPSVQSLKLQALECFKGNDFVEAMKLLEKAMIEDNDDPSVYLNIAIIQAASSNDNSQMAIDMLSKAISLDSDTVTSRAAHSLRSTLYERLGEDEKAREDVVMAAKMGDKAARDRLRMNNPYAAMCDEVVKGAMAKYCRGRE